MINAKEAKTVFQQIGNSYAENVLLGYIDFFKENWINRNNRDYHTRLNYLRLLVYSRIARKKGFSL